MENINRPSKEAWFIRPLEGTALAQICDENGLVVGTVIKEDAPLVAAAPDMLAALKDAEKAIEAAGLSGPGLVNIRAAIAKAEPEHECDVTNCRECAEIDPHGTENGIQGAP